MGRKKKTLSSEIEITQDGLEEGVSASSLESQIEKTRQKGRNYTVDLRIHSPKSLGYFDLKKIDTAPAMVRVARVKGLDAMAVTDFFSGASVDSIAAAASGSGIAVIPGAMLRCRVETCSDVTIACLFPEGTTSSRISDFLRATGVPQAAFGDRNFVLQTPLGEIISVVESFGGVCFPSRMDKTPDRKAVLPVLVEKYGFRAFDLAYGDSQKAIKKMFPKFKFKFFSFSNANALAQVGTRTARIKMLEPGFSGIKEALERESA